MTSTDFIQKYDLQSVDGPRAVWISDVFTPQCKFSHKISSRPTGTYAVHDHPFFELVYIVSGQVDFFVAGHVFSVGNGTFMTFPPGVLHGVLVHTDAPYERYTLHFDQQVLRMERRRLLLNAIPADLLGVVSIQQAENAVWRNMENSGVLQVLEAMETLRGVEQDKLSELLPIYLEAVLAALIPRAHNGRNNHAAAKRPLKQLEQIVSWVDQHYTEAISLGSLANRFYLSKGYLSALFRQATGSSVKDYVCARRMAHVQLLLSSGIPIAQAAARVGFGDYSTFYRAYVRSFGHAPSLDYSAGGQDALLEQALSVSDSAAPRGDHSVFFPLHSINDEDPSMVNAVWADQKPLPSK